MEVSTLIKNGRNVVFVKEKGINGKVVICVVEEVHSAREYVMNVNQNMSYAYIAMEQGKTNIDSYDNK